MAGQLAKIDLPNKDEVYLRERILEMYANPVRNYLAAQQRQGNTFLLRVNKTYIYNKCKENTEF